MLIQAAIPTKPLMIYTVCQYLTIFTISNTVKLHRFERPIYQPQYESLSAETNMPPHHVYHVSTNLDGLHPDTYACVQLLYIYFDSVLKPCTFVYSKNMVQKHKPK